MEWSRCGHRAAIPVQGQPRDLTSALLFFASEESRWVTGQTLIVDGGLSTRL
jgi:NAD(P)-dependent dehydrogenase (short-subunit alcohol dehydrogenase family)